MKDATREEVLDWCRDIMCDFVTPVIPPPNGWAWADSGDKLILTAIFTNTEDADITHVDLNAYPAPANLQ